MMRCEIYLLIRSARISSDYPGLQEENQRTIQIQLCHLGAPGGHRMGKDQDSESNWALPFLLHLEVIRFHLFKLQRHSWFD
ncbi:hypothetical protein RJT34_27264 [Clitoria ternatea]|uniref:Uncharacterized protein n=1 Tax=Clitoria ternatea TaxID=43366 RepID=A0AAN9F9X7_CLITE